jgi:flagellar basal body-associated protein FliL
MAEKSEKKPDAGSTSGSRKDDAGSKSSGTSSGGGGKAGMLTRTPVLLGGVMLIEALVLFAGFKFVGAGRPRAAAGAELTPEEQVEEGGKSEGEKGEKGTRSPDKKKSVEVDVLDFKAPNKMTGRTFVYDLKISILTRAEYESRVEETIKERKGLIQDRLRTIIAQSDPEKLGGASEPGLETLRRQVKFQLDEIIGEGLIDEVLVPRCIPFRTDY